jgi:glycosyltransferase involved in cell wall biosynthesis
LNVKIAILQGAFLPVPAISGGAVEKIWYRMGREFAALGHEIIHIGRSHPKLLDHEQSGGVTYLRVMGYDSPSSLFRLKWLDLMYSLRAVRHIPKDVDIIITNTFWSPLLLRGKRKSKVYVSVERVPRGQMKYYGRVGRLRGCSPAICDAIRKEIPETDHHLVTYVPNAVPFDVKPLDVPREKVVLFVGRLHPEKGVHVLLKAFSLINRELTRDWKLVVVGTWETKSGGGGEAYHKKLLGLAGNHVEFTGPVYQEQNLIEYYARSSIFCYPAQDGSGDAAPVAPREAMAYGCVPVVSSLPCFGDFISEGENGISYDQASGNQEQLLANTLASLMSDPSTLKNMSECARLVNREYAPVVVAEKFIIDFEKMSV